MNYFKALVLIILLYVAFAFLGLHQPWVLIPILIGFGVVRYVGFIYERDLSQRWDNVNSFWDHFVELGFLANFSFLVSYYITKINIFLFIVTVFYIAWKLIEMYFYRKVTMEIYKPLANALKKEGVILKDVKYIPGKDICMEVDYVDNNMTQEELDAVFHKILVGNNKQ